MLSVFIQLVNLTSLSSVVGAQAWIAVILNDLPWKQTDYSVVFEVAPMYYISDSFDDYFF